MDEHVATAAGNDTIPAHAGLRYGALRMGLMLVVGVVLYVVGMRSWLWLCTTVLISGLLSFFVLLRQREAAARSLEASLTARTGRRPSTADSAAPAAAQVEGAAPTDEGPA